MKTLNKLALILAVVLLMVSCGDMKVINGVQYDTYGLLNANQKKNPDVEYEIVVGNIIWSVLLFETIGAPIYFIGFSLYEPVGPIDSNKIIGAVN